MDAKKYKVIVVDDSKFSTKLIGEIIESDEHLELSSLFNEPEESISYCERNPVDVAIVDVVMPNISGIELAQKINKVSPETQIIMISSLNNERVIIDSIAAGASDFVQKPFSSKYLLTCIHKSIENYNKA